MAEMHHPAAIRAGRLLDRSAGPLVLFGLCLLFFWPLVFTNQFTWMQGGDLAYQVLPWFQIQATAWHSGHFPLWNPYSWVGQPLVGQGQPGVLNPINWPLFLSPLRNGWLQMRWLHAYFIALHYLAGLSTYKLCRDLGRSRVASLTGACIFAFGGFFASNNWPQMLAGAIWAPLVFMYQLRCLRGERIYANAAWSGLFWGACWLSGHHQIPIFLTLAVALIWAYGSFNTGRLHLPTAIAALISFAVMFCISAPQTLPALEYGRLATRWVGAENPVTWNQPVPYYVHRDFSLNPQGLLSVILPGFEQPISIFIGVAALSLAVLGTLAYWQRPGTGVFVSVALGSLVYSLGSFLSVEGIFYALLPMVEKARSPHMAIVLFTLAAAPLAAYGIDALPDLSFQPWHRPLVRGLLVTAAVLGIALLVPAIGRTKIGDDRWFLTLFFLLVTAGLYAARSNGQISSRQTKFTFLLVVLLELGMGLSYHFEMRKEKGHPDYLAGLREQSEVARYLAAQPGQFRIFRDEELIHINFGDWYGIEELAGYLASVTYDLTQIEPFSDNVRRLLGVRYYIGKKPFNTLNEEVFHTDAGVKVYKDAKVAPRAFSVREVVSKATIQDVRRALPDDTNNLQQVAFVVGGPTPPPACDGDGLVEVTHYSANAVSLAADLPCRRMVVLTDVYYPGWQARVDGSSASIVEVDGALRGIVLPAGRHQVTMTYRPASLLVGIVLAVLGLLLTLLLQFYRQSRPLRATA